MYHGDSRQDGEVVDAVMAAVYRQLNDHDLGIDTPFDAEEGFRRLAERMQQQDQSGAVRHGNPESGLSFRLLGPLQMTAEGQPIELGPEQEQRMLVVLLTANGAPVSHAQLINAIWDDQPDRRLDALYHLASRLRRRLASAGHAGVLTGANGASKLAVSADSVDAHRFRELVARASQLDGADDGGQAVALLEEALRLHQGKPLTGMRGRWAEHYRWVLTEERRAAELTLYETAIRYGESRERLPALDALHQARPDDERVAWLLMHALYRTGRQAEALDVRRRVARDLSETTGAAVKAFGDLYERILLQDHALLRPEALRFPVSEEDRGGMLSRVIEVDEWAAW
jgi:DNA-binding SARP family transcriptional activator